MKKRFGFTLPEVLVGMAVLALLLTVTLSLFMPQLKLTNITRNVADTQKDALKAEFDLTQALTQTNAQMVLNETAQIYYPGAGLAGPAIAFPVAYNNVDFFDAISPSQPAPNPALTDPLTGSTINNAIPAWNAFLVYFVDANHNLWQVTWPVSGCNGLKPSGTNTLRGCADLAYPNPAKDQFTDLYYPRISASAISYYATSSPASGASAVLLSSNVLALEVFSGDKPSDIAQPFFNPFQVVLLVKRKYASMVKPGIALPQNTGNNVQAGDTIMTLDTSLNTSIGTGY